MCQQQGIDHEKIIINTDTMNATAVSNPFDDIPHFDPHLNTPVDLFHCAVLGLIRTHYELIVSRLPKKINDEVIYQLTKQFKLRDSALPPYKSREYRNGDQ